jgi:hypothetical protein
MDKHPDRIVFEGLVYRLSGNYYRRHQWGKPGPTNLHRAIWEKHHGPVPDDCEIHHRDGDPFNNDLANLECVNASEHQRQHTTERQRAGLLKPPSDFCLERAAEWHASPEGLEWHSQNGKACWVNKKWHDVRCQQCGQAFATPFPERAKWCHLNCKMENMRQRRGRPVGLRPDRKKPRLLSGKRVPGQ